MAFPVNFYTLTKRENSTKRPDGTVTTFDCVVRSGTGILNPTIELEFNLAVDPSQLNYAYIPVFDRYYFVEEWTFDVRLWTARLSVDVLATYKAEIGAATLYVLRSSEEYDPRVIDNLYPTKTGCTFNVQVADPIWAELIGYGCFVVGVVTTNSHYGSINYYGLDAEAMRLLVDGLMDEVVTPTNFDFNELGENLTLNLVDPLQYIKSCVFIPVGVGNIPGTAGSGSGTIHVFNYDITVRGNRKLLQDNPTFNKTLTFNIPKHPQTQSRGNYVNSAPYTLIKLCVPPFGIIDIDTTVTCNAATITCDIEVDVPTGLAILSVYVGNTLINRLEASVGVTVQLSQVARDYLGSAMSATNGIIDAIGAGLNGDIAGAIKGGVNGIVDAGTALIPRVNSIGSGGAYAHFMEPPRLDVQFFEIVDDDIAQNGRPLCKLRNPATLGGYMRIQDGDVAIPGTASEGRTIKAYLEGGFYYE